MDTATQETLMGIAFFLSIFGIFYIYLTTRNRERMAMIEKGADPALFKRRPNNSNLAIKLGMFLMGAALGILMGNVVDATTKIQEEVAYFSMIFLFSGLSLVIYYMFIERKEKDRA
jgi:preprotein translocase subunit YajC